MIHFNGKNEAQLKQTIIDGSERYLKSLNPDIESVKVARLTQGDQFLGIIQAQVDY